jgi:hypothetical protein
MDNANKKAKTPIDKRFSEFSNACCPLYIAITSNFSHAAFTLGIDIAKSASRPIIV